MSLVERIMNLTDAIEDCVSGTDWAGATALDAERQELLHALFRNEPDAARDGGSRAILEQLRARTDAMLATVTGTRDALADTARQLQAAPGAVRAYESNGSRPSSGEYRK